MGRNRDNKKTINWLCCPAKMFRLTQSTLLAEKDNAIGIGANNKTALGLYKEHVPAAYLRPSNAGGNNTGVRI
jgi:hypothetical protein